MFTVASEERPDYDNQNFGKIAFEVGTKTGELQGPAGCYSLQIEKIQANEKAVQRTKMSPCAVDIWNASQRDFEQSGKHASQLASILEGSD